MREPEDGFGGDAAGTIWETADRLLQDGQQIIDGGGWGGFLLCAAKIRTRPSDFTFTFHFQALEKDMATHSSVLAWRTPGTAGPGGLPSMGSHRLGHD